ncbi:MAG: PhoU domain-containing protein [Candidatus Omnitrophica bacterium]|nr:PhoU domain-containing protein [Candidatus Omnitrophota bacterium]MDD5436435.1 PhoU domain-containing protein [Candidatus Omnitrophota bacterium]
MGTNEIRLKTIEMADKVYEILKLVEDGFLKNKMEFLTVALQEEEDVNRMERALTEDIMALSKTGADKNELSVLAQTAEMLERMGDEATGLIERIEVKVSEKLLFSEDAVKEFNEIYGAMKESVDWMREFLRTKAAGLKPRVVDNGFRVKELVESYRKEHADRLVRGLCTPMGANMYFDMLDFTGNLARHASNIVKLG